MHLVIQTAPTEKIRCPIIYKHKSLEILREHLAKNDALYLRVHHLNAKVRRFSEILYIKGTKTAHVNIRYIFSSLTNVSLFSMANGLYC